MPGTMVSSAMKRIHDQAKRPITAAPTRARMNVGRGTSTTVCQLLLVIKLHVVTLLSASESIRAARCLPSSRAPRRAHSPISCPKRWKVGWVAAVLARWIVSEPMVPILMRKKQQLEDVRQKYQTARCNFRSGHSHRGSIRTRPSVTVSGALQPLFMPPL